MLFKEGVGEKKPYWPETWTSLQRKERIKSDDLLTFNWSFVSETNVAKY